MAKKTEPRFCKDCGKDISDMHVLCLRCPTCRDNHRRETSRAWNQQNKKKKAEQQRKARKAAAEKTKRLTPMAKRNVTKALKGLAAERERAMLKPNRTKSVDEVIALAEAAGVSYGFYVATHRGV